MGQRWTTPEREITAADIAAFATLSGDTHPLHTDPDYAATTRFGEPIAHGPLSIAVTMGLLHELRLVDETVVALLGTQWTYLAPLRAGDVVLAEVTVTEARRSRQGTTGAVGRDIELRTSTGTVVGRGALPVMVRAREADGSADDPARAFGTLAWGEALADLLAGDEAFAAATATWDGSIGLVCDHGHAQQQVQLRVYRGRVLEAVRRTPGGPTFSLHASARTWTDLALAPAADLIRRANRGEVTTSGDAYEYIRMTKAVHLLVDAVRELAGKEEQ
ncbi:hypothetical protein GCM10011519_22810 [Marmoricola endophyticus]|uniref:MaoC-like domain-containing protein n=1 Tax=Marmoricola endophyticus TaxID=2040280 RepID=A0A917BL97_9ACTN|nr:hypothetical protein GCM10011519_22810 [Marmoricola endophyticus]